MTEQEQLVETAKNAITDVFTDQSVWQSQTADSLYALKEFIDGMLDTLE